MNTNWIDTAPCRGATAIFYPPGDRPRGGRPLKTPRDPWAPARAICATCPHTDACLERALDHEADGNYGRHGMAGGLTPAERQTEQRRRDGLQPTTARQANPADPMHGTLTGALKHHCPCDRCKPVKRAYMAAWRAANRDHLNAQQRAYTANRRGAA